MADCSSISLFYQQVKQLPTVCPKAYKWKGLSQSTCSIYTLCGTHPFYLIKSAEIRLIRVIRVLTGFFAHDLR